MRTLISSKYNFNYLEYDKDFYKDYHIFVKPINYPLSTKKIESLLLIADMQKYYQCNPVTFIDNFFNIELLDMQSLGVERTWFTPNSLLVCTRGFGKALSLDTIIPTTNGNKTMKDIKIGDYVFDNYGVPVKVINTSPIFVNHDCYEITFSDQEKIIADSDHIWSVYDIYSRKKELKDLTTKELFSSYEIPNRKTYNEKWDKDYHAVRYSVPMSLPLVYPQKEYDIDPYILGLWLGDGCSVAGFITCGNSDLEDIVKAINQTGYKIKSINNDSENNKKIIIHRYDDVPLITLLKKNNLFDNKHIPDEYLYGSVTQRLDLLCGLMDTDGTISKKGYAEFSQSVIHNKISDGFYKLLVSLGIKFTCGIYDRKCNGKVFQANRFCFTPSKELPCFKMPRKFNRLKDVCPIKQRKKQIVKIEKINSVETKCISVDSKDKLFLCGKKNTVTHNSSIIDLELMSKGMLFNNYWAYIASGSGSQAQNTFTTLEKLANDNIDTFTGSTGKIFKDEIVINNAAGDGFSHSSDGFRYQLYNGSFTQTMNANVDAHRGYRGTIIFDESAFLSDELMNVYGAFAAVNKNLKTGKDASGKSIDPIRQRCFPQGIGYQKIYISSASSVDTAFYRLYREFSKNMIMGDPDYVVLHMDCELAFKPTIRGELVAPLLSRSTVEYEMRTNPEKARREYYCQFTTEAGANAIVKRGVITRNEETRKPLHYNDTGEKKFWLLYDPARMRDNSVILVGEQYESVLPDGKKEKKARIVNLVNLMDVGKKIKSPMQTPDQVNYLRQMIIDYNGGADGYDNILGIYIDAGSGGGGPIIADMLMQNWIDKAGIEHRGLIDEEYSEEYVKKFPDAIKGKLHMMNPSTYKSIMYEAMIEMLNQDKISFTANYDNKGYLTVFDVDQKLINEETAKITEKLKKQKITGKAFEEKLKDELSKVQSVKTKTIKLDWKDEIALVNIDALKEELVNMVRKKKESGKDSFELTPEKANKMHDDRAYVCCMLGYALLQERRKDIMNRPKKSTNDIQQMFKFRQPKKVTRF